MTDSNLAGQPVDPVTGLVGGQDVTFTTGVDPAYAHAYPPAGDGSVFTVPDLPPASHAPHPELVEKLDHALEHLHTLLEKLDHVLEHLHTLDSKVNDLHQRLDDHSNHHQPLEGHITLHPVSAPGATVTGDTTTLG